MNDSLFHIAPPSSDRSPLLVSQEILSLISNDFSLTISDLCVLLHCKRSWIVKYVQPEVQHIFVNRWFRKYIIDSFPLDPVASKIGSGFYYFSQKDLTRWWNENAKASRQTKLIDMRPYMTHIPLKNEKLLQCLNNEGLLLYSLERTEWVSAKLPPLNDKLITVSEWLRENHRNSSVLAYRAFRDGGATRIQIKGKSLWLLPARPSAYFVAISAKLK